MKKLISSIILSSITAIVANAHGFWLEIDEKTNEAKFYFGDWEDNKKESGSKLERIKANVFYPTDVVKETKRNDNHIAFSLNKKSDLVVVESGEPRKAKDEKDPTITRKISYVKAGRTSFEPISFMDIVPLKENSNSFKLIYNNEVLKKSKITVVSPTGWEKTFMSDDKGEFTIHTPWIGQYLIEASFTDETKGEIDGKAFDKTVHSITYLVETKQGLPWNKK